MSDEADPTAPQAPWRDAEGNVPPEQPAFRPRTAPSVPDPLLVAMMVRYQRDLLHETAERLHDKSATLRTIAHLWYTIGGLSLVLMVSLLLNLLP